MHCLLLNCLLIFLLRDKFLLSNVMSNISKELIETIPIISPTPIIPPLQIDTVNKIPVRITNPISPSGFHQLWIQIQHKKLKSILLCATYRPPDCPVTCFVDDLMEKYSQALTYGKEVFIVGELNCDMLKITQEANALKDFCSSLNLTQLITSPTRVTPQSSTLIDVIMTSNTALVAELWSSGKSYQ